MIQDFHTPSSDPAQSPDITDSHSSTTTGPDLSQPAAESSHPEVPGTAPNTFIGPDGTPWAHYAPPPKTNALSIVAFIGSLLIPPVGPICGIIALKQTKKTGEKGRGFAIAGIVIGSIYTLMTFLVILVTLISISASDFSPTVSVTRSAQGPLFDEVAGYGDDPRLDVFYEGCRDGVFTDCSKLFGEAPIDSDYEEFSWTCGGRTQGSVCDDIQKSNKPSPLPTPTT